MQNRTSNQVSMISTTLSFCTDHAADTAGIGAFAGAKTAADNKLVLINQLGLIADSTTSGVTINTKQVRETMSNIALKCGNAVSAYAFSIGDADLKARVTFTLTELERLKKSEVTNICQVIHDEANTHIAAAGAYGYVAGDVTDLQTAIDLYRTDWQNPRQAQIAKKNAIATIKQIVREVIDEIFKAQMDKMVNTLKPSNPSFVNQYYLSREIIDLGSTSAKVRGEVTSENDGLPLSNVRVTVYETGTTNIVKQVITDGEGKYTTGPLNAGDYDFKWELTGYRTVTENNIHIVAGKEVKRDLVMEQGGGSATLEADVPANGIVNVQVNGLHIQESSTLRLEVTGSTLRFYASASNVGAPGAQYFEVAPGQIFTKPILEWVTVFGFDEEIEDFLNVQNVGATEGHYKMKFENLGA